MSSRLAGASGPDVLSTAKAIEPAKVVLSSHRSWSQSLRQGSSAPRTYSLMSLVFLRRGWLHQPTPSEGAAWKYPHVRHCRLVNAGSSKHCAAGPPRCSRTNLQKRHLGPYVTSRRASAGRFIPRSNLQDDCTLVAGQLSTRHTYTPSAESAEQRTTRKLARLNEHTVRSFHCH